MKYLYITFIIIFSNSLYAQQDPHYTQYMYNMNVINPAYAGSKENMAGSFMYRQQWVGLEGAPKTATFSIHSPVGKNVGLGLSAISDKIGPVVENNIYADFSYTLNLGNNNRLAFGLKAGATLQNIGLFSDIGNGYIQQPGDLAFSENTSTANLNLGTGLFYYNDNYYLALSIPNMLNSKHLDVTRNGQLYQFGSDVQHYFLTGGYVFNLSDNTKFKPSFLMKSAVNVPTSIDASANFMLYNKFEVGGSYRINDSFGVMVNYIISELNVTTTASHEIMLLFDLNIPKKASISPRYF